jgi:cation diffusion facilitator family transporter
MNYLKRVKGIGEKLMHQPRNKAGMRAVNVGLASNFLLAILKISVGIVGHSPALLAEGVNSTVDVVYYIVVSFFMRSASKPADDEHPFGHSQLESIGALVIGAFVMTTAIAIFWDAVNTAFDLFVEGNQLQGAVLPSLFVALFTVAAKIGLTNYTVRLGKQTKNPAVIALAYDHRNDVFSALAATLGIFFRLLGHTWVDPLAGALVAVVIFRTGIEIVREATEDLMDTVPGKALGEEIHSLVLSIPGIERIDHIQAHRFGPYLVVNITVCVDGDISVKEGDGIATQVEDTLLENISFMRQVHVHYHPSSPYKHRHNNLLT